MNDKSYYVSITAYDANKQIAFLKGEIENNTAKIFKMETQKKYHFQRIGKALVQQFLSVAKQYNAMSLNLISKDELSDEFWSAPEF